MEAKSNWLPSSRIQSLQKSALSLPHKATGLGGVDGPQSGKQKAALPSLSGTLLALPHPVLQAMTSQLGAC